jgi:hypothetical protein
MARIQTYSVDSKVSGNDTWIGSDGDNSNQTKNFSPVKLAEYFNTSEKIDKSNTIAFTYQTLDPGEDRSFGTISFTDNQPPYVLFSDINNILISKRSNGLKYVDSFLFGANETTIMLQRGKSVNDYGFYNVNSIVEYDLDPNFFVFNLSFIQGNGGLEEDKEYLFSILDISKTIDSHNDLAGLNDGDYIHLTQEEKERFDSLPISFATNTSNLINDGEDGLNPFITLEDIPPVDLSNLVPYTGATENVELGEKGLQAGYFKFDTTPTNVPMEQGVMYWDEDDNTIDAILNGYKMKIGEDQFYPVKNQTGTSIPKGTAVQFAGTLGMSGRLLIAPFIANGSVPSALFMGVTAETIANGEDGKVLWFGRIKNINTNAFNEGDVLYASTTTAGGFQTTIPQAPNNIVQIAAVISKSTTVGTIFVRPTLGSNINKDEGVKVTSPNTGDVLQLQSNGLWENKTLVQAGIQPTLTNPITGTGTTNRLPKFTGATLLGDSQIFDDGDEVSFLNYQEGALSVDNNGVLKTEPTFKNLSLGESYANVAIENFSSNSYSVEPNDTGYQYAKLIQEDLLKTASLLVMPQAFKAGSLALHKPLGNDLTVTRATTATRVNANGLIETVGANVPLIDHTGGGCPTILVQPQRTNLALRSEEFDNAIWVKENSIITSNSTISPDGTTNADELNEDNSLNFHRVSQIISVSNTTNSVSIFAKKKNRNFLVIRANISGANLNTCFNLDLGTITFNGHSNAKIEDYGNGWFKCSITETSPLTTTRTIGFLTSDVAVSSNSIPSYQGIPGYGIYLWGAQLEAGSNATSYIKTEASAVTRNADVISKTGISDLIGQTEGTVFLSFDWRGNLQNPSRLFQFNNGTSSSDFFINVSTTTGFIELYVNNILKNTLSNKADDTKKIIFRYTHNSLKIFINGQSVYSSDETVTFASLNTINIGSSNITSGRISNFSFDNFLVFKTALTDDECINLTTI